MSDTLKGILELVETQFGESIGARDESLVALASTPGLGPPDLCWLQKSNRSLLTGSAGEAQGYYHYALGGDVSSSAAVAAYFASITALVEPTSFMQGFFSASETKIDRGFYSCYDPFTRKDVRCELCIPGGVVCGAMDSEGGVHDVTPDLWRNCLVASFLRSELYDAELCSHFNYVRRIDPLPNQEAEKRLLAAVEDMYATGLLPGHLDYLSVDECGGCLAEHADLVLSTIFHYYARRQLWGTAMEFFDRLLDVTPTAAVYIAAVQRECGAYEEALSTLSSAVNEYPDDPQLLTALAHECLYAEQAPTAAQLARKALRIRGDLRPAWLVLARAYVRMGEGRLSLVTLNVVPPPPLPQYESEVLLTVGPTAPASMTKPKALSYDPDTAQAKAILAEEAALHSQQDSALQGAVLVNREPHDLGVAPDVAPMRLTRAVLAAVYSALQELVSVVGWDGFLELRSSVFVMHSDMEAEAAVARNPGAGGLPVQPGQAGAMDRSAPAGGSIEEALHDAAVMGMAEYPEYLEESGAPPEKVAAAAAAQRNSLLEIAARHQALEDEDEQEDRQQLQRNQQQQGQQAGPRQPASQAAQPQAQQSPQQPILQTPVKQQLGAQPQQPGSSFALYASPDGSAAAGGAGAAGSAGNNTPGGVVDLSKMLSAANVGGSASPAPLSSTPQLWSMIFGAAAAKKQQRPGATSEQAERLRAQLASAKVSAGSAGSSVSGTPSPGPGPSGASRPVAEATEVADITAPGIMVLSGSGSGSRGAVLCCPSSSLRRALLALHALELASARPHAAAASALPASATAAAHDRQMQRLKTVDGSQPLLSLLLQRGTKAAAQPSCRALSEQCASTSSRCVAAATRSSAVLEATAKRRRRPALAALRRQLLRGLKRRPGSQASGAAPGKFANVAATSSGRLPGYKALSAYTPDTQQRLLHAGAHSVRVLLSASKARQAVSCAAEVAAAAAAAACLHGSRLSTSAAPTPTLRTHLGRPAATMTRTQTTLTEAHTGSRTAIAPVAWASGPIAEAYTSSSEDEAVEAARRQHHQQRQRSTSLSGAPSASLSPSPATATTTPSALPASSSVPARKSAQPHHHLHQQRNQRDLSLDGAELADDEGGSDGDDADSTRYIHDNEDNDGYDEEQYGDHQGGYGGLQTMGAGQAPGGSGGSGGGVQPYDYDRGALLMGHGADKGVKRLSVRWLDELIIALWHDLQAYLDWKALDHELAAAGYKTHAEIVAGLAPAPPKPANAAAASRPSIDANGSSGSGVPGPKPPALPELSQADWIRRGLLAERLYHDADALLAYRAAVAKPGGGAAAVGGKAAASAAVGGAVGPFSMVSWTAILRLASDMRDPGLALQAVKEVMEWHDVKAAAGAPPGTRVKQCPVAVVQCMSMLVAAVGYEGVMVAQQEAVGQPLHPAAQRLLQGLTNWRRPNTLTAAAE